MYSRRATEFALNVTGKTFQEALGRRLEDWQRENLAVEVERHVAAQLLGEILEDLLGEN